MKLLSTALLTTLAVSTAAQGASYIKFDGIMATSQQQRPLAPSTNALGYAVMMADVPSKDDLGYAVMMATVRSEDLLGYAVMLADTLPQTRHAVHQAAIDNGMQQVVAARDEDTGELVRIGTSLIRSQYTEL